jgi:hypothetical protein
MTLESINQKVKEYQFVVALFVVYLLYAVYFNSQAIKGLHGEAMTLNPYATRLPTIVDSGLTTNQVLEWGNQVNGNNCPTPEQADAYLSSTAGSYYGNTEGQMHNNDSFMSGYEPPVFWPIGNVQKVRDSRVVQNAPNRKHSWNNNQNVNHNNNAPNNTGFQYTTSNVPAFYENGTPKYMMNNNGQQMLNNNGNPMPEVQEMYSRCAPGENVVDNVCVESYAANPNSWQSNSGRKEMYSDLEGRFEY